MPFGGEEEGAIHKPIAESQYTKTHLNGDLTYLCNVHDLPLTKIDPSAALPTIGPIHH